MIALEYDYDTLVDMVSEALAEAIEILEEEGPYREWESILSSIVARMQYDAPEVECIREALGVVLDSMRAAGAPFDAIDRVEHALGILEEYP